MALNPDDIWEIVEGCNSFENFCNKMVPTFPISETIPAPVARRLELIRKLIKHSYYEYEFMDVAMLQSFQVLELALHLRYEQQYPGKRLKNLKPYLDWALREKIISVTPTQKETVNYLRNHTTHLKEESLLGMISLNTIRFIGCDIIGSLFKVN